jgi:hypothetical protein
VSGDGAEREWEVERREEKRRTENKLTPAQL